MTYTYVHTGIRIYVCICINSCFHTDTHLQARHLHLIKYFLQISFHFKNLYTIYVNSFCVCVCDFQKIFVHAKKYAMFINAANCASCRCRTDKQLRPPACGVGCCVSHNLSRPRLCVVFVASAYVCVSVYVFV